MNKLKAKFHGFAHSKAGKRIMAFAMSAMLAISMAFSAAAEGEVGSGADAIAAAKSVIGEATKTINISNLTTILVYGVGIAIGLFLLWWGARKLVRIVTAAFKRGKVSV